MFNFAYIRVRITTKKREIKLKDNLTMILREISFFNSCTLKYIFLGQFVDSGVRDHHCKILEVRQSKTVKNNCIR